MAHEIDLSTGRAAIFTAGEPAWHRLGTVVAQAQTSAEAIKLAGLDWSVEKRNVAAAGPNGTWIPVEGQFATVRSDTQAALGVVGSFYRPFQNVEAFDFMDNMLLTNSHDGTSGLRIIPTTVRVVCNNTLTLALRNAGAGEGLSIVHTDSLDQRVAEARNKLGVIAARMDRFELESQGLARKRLTRDELAQYFAGLVADRSEKSAKGLLESFEANLANERNTISGIGGSAWAAYNAVSEWADHQMRVLGTGDVQLDARVQSIWFGSANRVKQAAWESAIALAS